MSLLRTRGGSKTELQTDFQRRTSASKGQIRKKLYAGGASALTSGAFPRVVGVLRGLGYWSEGFEVGTVGVARLWVRGKGRPNVQVGV